ncbi:SUMF1/EgtB/PvdO family nonheme iron enzyme [Lentisphaerota bacterium WC36G]|nr:SUMF1/EgtB/PvdO family nonheme iron enzyme [Lentisphaerae bacterium WC36]
MLYCFTLILLTTPLKATNNDKKIESAILAVKDIIKNNPKKYPNGQEYLKKLQIGDKTIIREALLANPILDFDEIIVIEREKDNPATPGAVYIQTDVPKDLKSNIIKLTNLRGKIKKQTIFSSEKNETISDIDINFENNKIMFTKVGSHNRWQIFEYNLVNNKLQQLTPKQYSDFDSFDSCYLPDGNIVFMSTASFQGLPCEFGRKPIASMYKLNRSTNCIRQLTFDQDSDWNPTVMESGRILYTRWEYSDVTHYFSRIIMTMNPDGTDQKGHYGSNSYWPNSTYFAKPIPGDDSQFIAVVTGHHTSREGRLVLFDTKKGRHETSGVIQAIPGRNKTIKNAKKDHLYKYLWPKFLNPQPLGTNHNDGAGKYFIVSGKLSAQSPWGIYLVDIFDNIIPITQGEFFFEPIPVNKKKKPYVIPNKVDLNSKTATFFINDIYAGQGLIDIPRDSVKSLRIFEYDFAYMHSGTAQAIGMECGWDVKRILGTVSVEKDGSAMFTGPANTPIAVQPLNKDGQALQLMKSWMVAMPGETLTCVGCHENQNETVKVKRSIASTKVPQQIRKWYGDVRGFSFKNEIQNTVLDKYCIACHNGKDRTIPDFKNQEFVKIPELAADNIKMPISYLNLHPFVRRPGTENDNHMDYPLEYNASTSELVRILKKGHHNVQLSNEAWDRLYTWIDLNVPYNGSWEEAHRYAFSNWAGSKSIKHQNEQMKKHLKARKKYAKLFANKTLDGYGKAIEHSSTAQAIKPIKLPYYNDNLKVVKLKIPKKLERLTFNVEGEKIEFVKLPTGKFIMGSKNETVQEYPRAIIEIKQPFFMATTEVSNALYAKFDKTHDSRYYPRLSANQEDRGWPLNKKEQPVVRVSFHEAMAFCNWLSEKIGRQVTIPTEAQWEWAARAGSQSDMFYGTKEDDFSQYANLADYNLRWFGVPHGKPHKKEKVSDYCSWLPRIKKVNDNFQLSAKPKSYNPNQFGLYDMIGNVAEWTRSKFLPYPYNDNDNRNTPLIAKNTQTSMVIRGGSWITRPKYATSSYRYGYKCYQKVFDVGIRLIIED